MERNKIYISRKKVVRNLERYKLREGPIYVYSNKTKDYPMLKIENASWIKSHKEKFYSSSQDYLSYMIYIKSKKTIL